MNNIVYNIKQTHNATSLENGTIHTEGGVSIKKDLRVAGTVYCNTISSNDLPVPQEVPLSVSDGGTGVTYLPQGQILIGNNGSRILTDNNLYFDLVNKILYNYSTADSTTHGTGCTRISG